jgi:hypothetical protein
MMVSSSATRKQTGARKSPNSTSALDHFRPFQHGFAMSGYHPEAEIGTAGVYDGVDDPPTASICQSGGVEHQLVWVSLSMFFTPTAQRSGVERYSASGSAEESC